MKVLFIACVCFPVFLLNANADNSIVGRWAFFMKIYQGHEMPEDPEASLRLRYEFSESGESHLYWWHENGGDHCERLGRYRTEGNTLIDQVIWINPKNSYGCGQDPDMRLGITTKTTYSFHGENLVLPIAFGEETLFYVWKKLTSGEE